MHVYLSTPTSIYWYLFYLYLSTWVRSALPQWFLSPEPWLHWIIWHYCELSDFCSTFCCLLDCLYSETGDPLCMAPHKGLVHCACLKIFLRINLVSSLCQRLKECHRAASEYTSVPSNLKAWSWAQWNSERAMVTHVFQNILHISCTSLTYWLLWIFF